MNEKTKVIYLSSPTMNGREMKYINEAFETNWIAPLGKNVDEFEKEIANKAGVKYGAALTSGTAAIHMALKCAGIEKNDIVICSTLTFAASCNPILYEGAIPVFVDSEYETWNMDPVLLRKALQIYPEAKAVITVNLYGTPAKLNEIAEICHEFKVTLIEDAAESLGASLNGKQTGSFGDYGVFSFNGNKIITTSGGGMIVSNNKEKIDKVRFWATQSKENVRHYEHKELGYNYRMSNIVAGIGRGQLETLEEFIQKKKKIYECYKEAFCDREEIEMNPVPKEMESNYWLSCILLKELGDLCSIDILQQLEKENINARPIWKPIHKQPIYRKYDCITRDGLHRNTEQFESVAEDIYNRGVCLPSDIKNTDEDMKKIIEIVRKTIDSRSIAHV